MSFAWWQKGVIYQIYPRSFQDSNGDGIGDLAGILTRVDYLKWLGVDAVWISPIYPSPMADFGYDISDYTNIDPVYGILGDLDAVVDALHRVGIKLILDYVPNHTSIAHPWFVESRRSRSAARRNWYIWRDPRPGGAPPTNWLSQFGGSAWTFDPATEQYYYHAYLPEQPDLNWRNPDVQAAMLDVLRFWLDRGVDGFRVDAIHMLLEDERMIDNPSNPAWTQGQSPSHELIRTYTADLPEVHTHIAAMRRVADEYQDRALIGEAYLPIERLMLYYGESLKGFQLPFNFHLISTPWMPRRIAELIEDYERSLPTGAWPNWVLGNHDKSRVRSRLGSDANARLAAMLLLTLRGTPTLYNGDEIGMHDGRITLEHVRDPWEKKVPGLGLGRDPCRTPLLWDDGPSAGFTSGEPWLPLNSSHNHCNVAAQIEDPHSILNLYRALLELRRNETALSVGALQITKADSEILIFERIAPGRRLAVVLNFSACFQSWQPPIGSRALLSTLGGRGFEDSRCLTLRPLEGLIVALEDFI